MKNIIFDVDGTFYNKKKPFNTKLGSINDSHEFFRYATYSKALARPDQMNRIAKEVITEYNKSIQASIHFNLNILIF